MTRSGVLAYPPPVNAGHLAGTNGFWWAPRTSNPLSGISVSGVGSIPTRSRHRVSACVSRSVLAAAFLVLLLCLPCERSLARGGARTTSAKTEVDSTSVGRAKGFDAPVWVMTRSVLVPGWGQAHNRKWLKAALFAGAEGALVYGILEEDRLAKDADEAGDFALGAAHRANKKDYLWWGAFVVLLSAGDAYVDAHLRGFRAEFREDDSAVLLRYEVAL